MPRNSTEVQILEALDRLVHGESTHPDLVNRKYELTPTNLAKESRISRNTLYTIHRPVLDKLKQAREAQQLVTPPPLTASEKHAELRAINRQLETDLRKLATKCAVFLARENRAEEERDAAKDRNQALLARAIAAEKERDAAVYNNDVLLARAVAAEQERDAAMRNNDLLLARAIAAEEKRNAAKRQDRALHSTLSTH